MFLKQLIFSFRYKRAVRRANDLAQLTGLKYLVIVLDGKLKVVPKKTIRKLIATHRFRHGVKLQDIVSRALYVSRTPVN